MGWVTDEAPTRAELEACVQCGLCLPQCPTYRLTGKETASPRGRLMAMSAVAEGVIAVDEAFAEVMSFCLQCRACEVVCPSLVPFGRAMEGARAEVAAQLPTVSRKARGLVVGRALRTRPVIRAATLGAKALQKSGLDRALPAAVRTTFSGLRPLGGSGSVVGQRHVAVGETRGTIGLLSGCVMDPWFGDVHVATIEVLRRAGFDIIVPEAQTCCGALAAHDGDTDETRRMATTNVAAFEGCDFVVTNSAGCGAHLREYGHWAGHGGRALSDRVRDVTEVVAEAVADGRLPASATDRGPAAIQDPCHLRHAQRIVDEPRQVVSAAGFTAVEIDPEGRCCGAAGMYSVTYPETSRMLGEAKAEQIRTSGSTIVVSANPGCEMQLRAHLGAGYRVVHPIELYWEALRDDEGGR